MTEFEDDEEKSSCSMKPPTTEILHIEGKTFTIDKLPAFHFFSQNLQINRGDVEVVNINARIKIMHSNEGAHIIEMKDDLYFPKGKYKIVDDPLYIPIIYRDMCKLYEDLGYKDFIPDHTIYGKLVIGLLENHKKYVEEFWERNKSKLTKVER